jgi:hypothetical protein
VTHKPELPVAIGVDGCKGGWIAALCYRLNLLASYKVQQPHQD